MKNNLLELFNKAKIAFAQKEYNKAAMHIRKFKKLSPTMNTELSSLEINILFDQLKFEKATSLTEQILPLISNTEQKRELLNISSIAYVKLKIFPKAIEQLEASLALDGTVNNAQARLNLLKLYAGFADYEQAEKIASKLLKWGDYRVLATMELLAMAKTLGDKELVIRHISALSRYFLYLNDQDLSNICSDLINVNAIEDAKLLIQKDHENKGEKNWHQVQLARIDFIQKKYPQALSRLGKDAIDNNPFRYNLRARIHEKLKNYDNAFLDFTQSAKLYKQEVKKENQLDFIKYYQKVNLANIKHFPLTPEQAQAIPVFLVGFPRSGTTLLDTILDTQKNVLMLSETRSISCIIDSLTNRSAKSYPENLTGLTASQVNKLRDIYLEYAQKQVGEISSKQILIDKMPINTIHIPLLQTLFPQCKIIVSLRHPLDVCLSNFQQNYDLNTEMSFLVTLDDCVKRYLQVFDLLAHYQQSIQSNLIFVRYEDLVNNLAGEAKKIFNFIDMDYDQSFLDFHKHATNKAINTASKHQVNQPLYNSSVYKWKNYEHYLGSYITSLQPYIKKFGYAD